MIEKIAPRQDPPSEASDAVRQAYFLRIEELKGYAIEDDIEVNSESERDFHHFTNSTSLRSEAALFLMDNGNLRAVWKDANGGHVGIQFLGKQQAECVIFNQRVEGDFVSRVAGHDTLDGVRRQIAAFDLVALVGI